MEDQNFDEAQRWFSQATHDLEAVKISIDGGMFDWACFQSQQSAEKAVKAFLFLHRRRSIISHSIRQLVEDCIEIDARCEVLRPAKKLDQYYIPTRCPNGLPEETPYRFYTKEDAEECVTCAEKVIAYLSPLLNESESTSTT